MDGVLHDLVPISTLHEGAELGTDFKLTGASDFMVMHFDRYSSFFEQNTHFRAHVLHRINWRNWKIAPFNAWTMSEIATLVICIGRPKTFIRFDLDVATGHVITPGDAIKYKELWLWAKESRVTQAA